MKKIIPFLAVVILFLTACEKETTTSERKATGQAGSITRFAIKDNYMYTIDVNYIKVFDISNNDNPVFRKSIKLDYGLETITIYGNSIYVGANDGIYYLDIKNPENPVPSPKVNHEVSCDPVAVQGHYAYSTQNAYTIGCGHAYSKSILAVYDVQDPQNIKTVSETDLEEPYGIAAEGNWLFVCDNNIGVMVFDISNPEFPIFSHEIPIANTRDVILNYPYMLVSSLSNVQLYNYSDIHNITLVSTFQTK